MVVRPVHTGESSDSYALHAVGNHDGGQAGAIIESIGSYARHAVRNREGGQTGAICESSVSYARNTIGKRDGGQAGAAIESTLSYARHVVFCAVTGYFLGNDYCAGIFSRWFFGDFCRVFFRYQIIPDAINLHGSG